MRTAWRRRRLVVDGFQYTFIGFNLAYLLGAIVVLVAVIFAPIVLVLTRASSTPDQMESAATAFLELHRRIWPAVALCVVLISIHSMLVSHRIAGPLFRFRKVFRAVAGGNLSVRAGVRRKDYLGQQAEAINEMLQSLEERLTAIRREAQGCHAAIEVLQGGSGGVGGKAAALERLRTGLASIEAGAGWQPAPPGETACPKGPGPESPSGPAELAVGATVAVEASPGTVRGTEA